MARPTPIRSTHWATPSGARSCACSGSATWPCTRSPTSCRSAGRPSPGTCGCSRSPGWSRRSRGGRGGSTASRRRGCSPSRPTCSRSGVMRPPGSGSPPRTCRQGRAGANWTWPLRLYLEVDCTPEDAFDVWTHRFSLWWPADHTVTGDPALVALEPRLGGRIYERGADGTEHEWGEITVVGAARAPGLPLAPDARPHRRHGRGDHLPRRGLRHARRDRAPRLGAPRCRRRPLANPQPGGVEHASPPLREGSRERSDRAER